MLLADRPRRALVVGQGTGVTLGELALWERIETLELVELSETVVRALPLLGEYTSDVHLDPRLTIRVEDARHRLRQAEASWDVIVAEPSNPWIAGMDLLFSVEWFRAVDRSLAPDGVFLQWIQLYDTNEAIFCSILRSMAEVFTELRAFRGSSSDWLIVAMRAPPSIDIASRKFPPAVAASLAELGIATPEELAKREVRLFPLLLDRYRETCAIHRARDSDLAYRAAEAMYHGTGLFEPDLFAPGITRSKSASSFVSCHPRRVLWGSLAPLPRRL